MMLASVVHGKHFHKYKINYVCDVCKIRNVSAVFSKMVGGTNVPNMCLKGLIEFRFFPNPPHFRCVEMVKCGNFDTLLAV